MGKHYASDVRVTQQVTCPHCRGTVDLTHKPLTRRQYDILSFIQDYIGTNGYAPTFEKIAAWFDLSSLATVHEHITNLERKGYIKRYPMEARGIAVIGTVKEASDE